MPTGHHEEGAAENTSKWFTLEEINQIRSLWTDRKGQRPLAPVRPTGVRAVRAAIANFKGGAGKSTTALHFAHAAALEGYKVLVVDFDPQATITHALGITDITEEQTVWGIIGRDLMRETLRLNLERQISKSREEPIRIPSALAGAALDAMTVDDFILKTSWSSIDLIGSCANAAFVEFATAQYRAINDKWSFFAAVDRFLGELAIDRYDFVIFDCPPAIGYQSLNAVFAADVLYIPTGPGYWEYDSTTSFMAQLAEALRELGQGYEHDSGFAGRLPKRFNSIHVVLTRFVPSNELHVAMREGLMLAFGDWLTSHPVEHSIAVEQTGRFLRSIYEMDYRQMQRETWRRARNAFDAAYDDFRKAMVSSWAGLTVEPEKRQELGELK
jgi:cellulose biosynthesis protein BcsQ